MLTQYTKIPFEVFTLDNVLSDEELTYLTEFVDSQSNINCRTFTNSDFINGKLVEPSISKLLYTKVQPFLPNMYIDSKCSKWKYKGSTDTIMFAKILPGKHFGIHTDTGCEYDRILNKYSKYTMLLYLNDDFKGGHTVFYNDNFKEQFKIQPKKGRILCFDIGLYHSGESVLSGTKKWIGAELVCSKVFWKDF
jgi:hypothetical protein